MTICITVLFSCRHLVQIRICCKQSHPSYSPGCIYQLTKRQKGPAQIQYGRPVTWLTRCQTHCTLPLGLLRLLSPHSPLGPFQEMEHNAIPWTVLVKYTRAYTQKHTHYYICTVYHSQEWQPAPKTAGVQLLKSAVQRRRLPIYHHYTVTQSRETML